MDSNEQPTPRRNVAWIIVVIVLGLLFAVLPPIAAEQDDVYHTFTPLLAIKSHIQRNYVEQVDDQRLIDGAIRGMIDRLDPFSVYMSPADYAVFKERASGGYVGIGVFIRYESETRDFLVVGPTENSPAYRAGVRTGDIIVEIAGVKVETLNPIEARNRLLGVEGSTAHFKVRRPPNHDVVSFAVQRSNIPTRSVRGCKRSADESWDYLIDETYKIGYIQISEFWRSTVTEFDAAVSRLREQDVRALVLDLRFDPGGDMDAAIGMVDRFISHGAILSTRNRREVVSSWQATKEGTLPDWPVVVLVNGVSASGAEILAGALQDHKRATVVGQRSFGKGSVQAVIELEDNKSALRLTTAYYYLPSDRCIHRREDNKDTDEWGIIPDIVVEIDHQEDLAILDSWYESSVIRGSEDERAQASILIDKQLQRSLEVLREKLR